MNMDETKINIQELNETNSELLCAFHTYDPDLQEFLIEDAYANQKIGISKTYLLCYENKIIGYITLLADTLRLEGELKEFFKNKNVTYKSLPALKIGRLAIDDNYLKNGFGTKLLIFAHTLAEHTSKNLFGCRFLIVDAKRNSNTTKNSIHFYKKFGFQALKERIKGTLPLYLDIQLREK
jgi:GNAT superfamily N-acetyltransferase